MLKIYLNSNASKHDLVSRYIQILINLPHVFYETKGVV
jgi:hypothetical protein